MLKRLYIFYIVIFSLAATQMYGQNRSSEVIYIPYNLPTAVQESVKDMSYWLKRSTGKNFIIITDNRPPNDGIHLLWANESGLSKPIQENLRNDGQSFYLKIDSYDKATIVGTGKNSFNNAIYTFLHELGFRWYMPGDAWIIIPKLTTKSLKVSKVYTPDFQNRSYFGTGGINAVPGLDPQNTFKQDFELWNRRNRINTDYAVKGHMGQAFYNANKKVLDGHPEYFCNNNVNKNGRINIGNQAVVSLFTEWALSQVKDSDQFPIIGVDPADGSGGKDDCLPGNMPTIKTWSDKYFWLANKVADKIPQNDKKTIVQLYAYASHADVPRFALHRKVYPVIIPYAFQKVATPEEYIRKWYKKMYGQPMGIYDYWNITQWSNALPQFNIYTIPVKLRFWKQHNITTINLESTNSKGPMGHALWLAFQMMWNTQMSFDSLYNDFLHSSFGPAANDIKRIYNRWSLNYQHTMDVSLSLNDLAAASAKTKDSAILERIAELKAYVHYIKLYYDYQNNPTVNTYQELINYMYGIHHLRLLQTSALQTRYIKVPKGLVAAKDKSAIALQNEQIKKLSFSEIVRIFEKDKKESPQPYSISSHVFDISKTSTDSKAKEKYNPRFINGKNSYIFYVPVQQQFSIQVGATKETKLIIIDDQKKTWIEKNIIGSKESYETIKLVLPRGKYALTFGDYNRFSRIIFPENIPFLSTTNFYDNYQYPLIYVYVPKDVTEIIYKDGYGPGINKRGYWISPDGKKIQPKLLKYDIYRIPISPQLRGKVWVLNIGHRSFELLNIPNVFSLNNFEYVELE